MNLAEERIYRKLKYLLIKNIIRMTLINIKIKGVILPQIISKEMFNKIQKSQMTPYLA